MLIVAYPLSAGPVTWLIKHGCLTTASLGFLQTVYLPVKLGMEASEVFESIMAGYLEWWQSH